jgi:spermidine/putrescine transport system substrate-binding protein
MDYVYQPKIAAMIADYVNYITPVPDAKAIFEQDAKDADNADDKSYYEGLVKSPLIFPTKADYAKLHRYRVLTKAEQTVWNNIFQPIYQS